MKFGFWRRGRQPRKRTERGRFFRKSLAIVLFISSLPTALIAVSTYLISTAHIEQEVEHTHWLRLKQASEQLNAQIAQVEILTNQLAQNHVFNEQLNMDSYDENFRLAQNMFELLTKLNHSDRMIQQVQLYIERKNVLISPDRGAETITSKQDSEKYAETLKYGEGFFWKFGLTTDKDELLSRMTLVHKLPVISSQPYGAFIVDLDPEEMNALLRGLNPDGTGAAFILNNDMEWVTTGTTGKHRMSPLADALRDAIAAGKTDASFRFVYEGKKYAVGQMDMPRVGLKFVTAIPLTLLTQPVVIMSHLMIAASLLGLIIAILLSWFASHKLYQPVSRLVGVFRSGSGQTDGEAQDSGDELAFIEKQWLHLTRESQVFQKRLEQSLPALRDGFLLKFVEGHFYYMSEQDIRERMETYGCEVADKRFSLTVIELFGISQMEGKFSEGDEQLVTFAAANIVEELVHNRMPGAQVINFQDLSIGLFLMLPDEGDIAEIKQKLVSLAEEIIHYLHTMLKMNVTISVGKLTHQLKAIPDLTVQARQALRYRDLEEGNQILEMDGWSEIDYEAFTYPLTIEKEILQAVRMGQVEETVRLIEGFMSELTRNSAREFFVLQGMLQLLGSIHHTIIQSGYKLHAIYGGSNLHEELTQQRGSGEMLNWFRIRVIEPYVRWIAETQDMKLKQLVEKVITMIHQHYMTDISLESCADLQGTYMKKLSLGFKQITGMNFIDYLTKVRLDKAKELLQQTDDKINDIAEQVGYQPPYFIRIFKKYEGMTPGQFRDGLNGK